MIVLSVTSAATLAPVAPVTASATPGDNLYPVKRLNEPIVLSIAISDITKGQHLLDFAGNRLREADWLNAHTLPGLLDEMDAQTTSGVRMLSTAAVLHGDESPFDVINKLPREPAT